MQSPPDIIAICCCRVILTLIVRRPLPTAGSLGSPLGARSSAHGVLILTLCSMLYAPCLATDD